ncbi:MAG TPA: indolepyruvate oxidoreductase subunit beta [Rhizomicrobium sp.]|nr:indolepyruvate oxidoreductase subunit beta [Rhizomicrobium sp.]
MPEVTSILLVGVGGQGTILVSSILSKGLVAAGYDVKMSEIHGMAQRGGSVSTQVRFGAKVHSPIVGRGGADILVAFETMEAARWLPFLKPGGKVIVNDLEIPPAPVLMGRAAYPKGLLDILRARFDATVVNAHRLAEEAGTPRVMNVVLFGALVEAAGLTGIDWEAVIASTVKPAFLDANIAAFRAGCRAAKAKAVTREFAATA